ncbi:MAG: methyltransferase domain-containing protein [Myxococcales bacterium FL481]|nr:MAG: methyltransferase domain-containing protein [Myxococcales bacterium FL481]
MVPCPRWFAPRTNPLPTAFGPTASTPPQTRPTTRRPAATPSERVTPAWPRLRLRRAKSSPTTRAPTRLAPRLPDLGGDLGLVLQSGWNPGSRPWPAPVCPHDHRRGRCRDSGARWRSSPRREVLHCRTVPEQARPEVRTERLARVIDREVAPIWHDRFAKLLLRHVEPRPDTVALDVHCAAGRTTSELLRRLPDSSRVLALGDEPAELTLARARIAPKWNRRVYFKEGNFDDVLEMPDDTYDLAVANLVLTEEVLDWEAGLAELVRVTKPGGKVLASVPLAGTWAEAEDLLDETLRDLDQLQPARTLDRFRRRRPQPTELAQAIRALGVSTHDYLIEHERFSLLFRSGREFLFSPVIEHGPLGLWKAIVGDAERAKRTFWRLKEAIDTYYERHVFSVSVAAAAIVIHTRLETDQPTTLAATYWSQYPSLHRLWTHGPESGPAPDPAAVAQEQEEDEGLEFDISVDDEPATEVAADGSSSTRAPANDESTPRSNPSAASLSPSPPASDAERNLLADVLAEFEPPTVDDEDLEEVFEGAFDLGTPAPTRDEPSAKRRTIPPAPPPKGGTRASRSPGESPLPPRPASLNRPFPVRSPPATQSMGSPATNRIVPPPVAPPSDDRSDGPSEAARPPDEADEGTVDATARPANDAPIDPPPEPATKATTDEAAADDAQRRYGSIKATQMLQAVPTTQSTRRERQHKRGRWGRQRGKA